MNRDFIDVVQDPNGGVLLGLDTVLPASSTLTTLTAGDPVSSASLLEKNSTPADGGLQTFSVPDTNESGLPTVSKTPLNDRKLLKSLADEDAKDAAAQACKQLDNAFMDAPECTEAAARRAYDRVDRTVKKAGDQLNTIAKADK